MLLKQGDCFIRVVTGKVRPRGKFSIPLSSPEPLEFLVTFGAPLVGWLSIEGFYKALDPLPFASQFAIAKVANKVFATYSVLCN